MTPAGGEEAGAAAAIAVALAPPLPPVAAGVGVDAVSATALFELIVLKRETPVSIPSTAPSVEGAGATTWEAVVVGTADGWGRIAAVIGMLTGAAAAADGGVVAGALAATAGVLTVTMACCTAWPPGEVPLVRRAAAT